MPLEAAFATVLFFSLRSKSPMAGLHQPQASVLLTLPIWPDGAPLPATLMLALSRVRQKRHQPWPEILPVLVDQSLKSA